MFETLGNFVMAEHLWRMTFDPPEERLRMPSFQPAGRVGLTGLRVWRETHNFGPVLR